jgi:exoribonuclease R
MIAPATNETVELRRIARRAMLERGLQPDFAHARQNTTSVYTAAQTFPMLPERLSTDLTSLGEGVDRLAVVVELTVGTDGAVAGSAVVKLLGRGEYVAEPAGQAGPGHFALAVLDYAHSTAPNRRFPDLVTHRLVKAALAGRPPPYRPDELDVLAAHVGERFEAVVTGVTDEGVWVRIARPMAEGKLVRGFEALDVGDRIQVELVETDVERGFIDFTRSR